MPMIDATQTHALGTVAWRHLRSGRSSEARILFELLVKLMPARGEWRLALAFSLLGIDRPAEALGQLEVLAASHDPIAHFLRGKALARMGCLPDARLAFERYRLCRQQPTRQQTSV